MPALMTAINKLTSALDCVFSLSATVERLTTQVVDLQEQLASMRAESERLTEALNDLDSLHQQLATDQRRADDATDALAFQLGKLEPSSRRNGLLLDTDTITNALADVLAGIKSAGKQREATVEEVNGVVGTLEDADRLAGLLGDELASLHRDVAEVGTLINTAADEVGELPLGDAPPRCTCRQEMPTPIHSGDIPALPVNVVVMKTPANVAPESLPPSPETPGEPLPSVTPVEPEKIDTPTSPEKPTPRKRGRKPKTVAPALTLPVTAVPLEPAPEVAPPANTDTPETPAPTPQGEAAPQEPAPISTSPQAPEMPLDATQAGRQAASLLTSPAVARALLEALRESGKWDVLEALAAGAQALLSAA